MSRTITQGLASHMKAMGIDSRDLGRPRNTADVWTELPKDFAVPSDPEQLSSLLNDESKMKYIAGNSKVLGEVMTAYAGKVLNDRQEVARQVREQTQSIVASWLKENGAQVERPDLAIPGPGNARTPGVNALHNPRAMGAALDGEFQGFGDYFQTIWHNTNRDSATQAKFKRMRNAFSSTVPSEGGFLIPETLRAEILRLSLETGIMRSRARVIPMETLRVPFPAIDETSHASSVFGGVVCYWTQEGATFTASQAQFGQVVLEAAKLTAYCEVPNELIADSIGSFEAFISGVLPEAMAFYEDDGFINGSGAGEPLGIRRSNAMISVTKVTDQAADTIMWENIVSMYSRMLPSSHSRAVWIASIDTFPELATMALNVGTGGSAVWLNNGVEGPAATILGRPVIFTEKSPVLGDAGDIMFVDPAYYLIGDRQVMSAMSSPHFMFSSDKTAFRIISRVDGRPWLNSAITPKNGGASLSPFVQIEARA